MKENFDMRGYAKYLEENNIPGKNVPQEVMEKFVSYEPTEEIKDLLEAIGKTKSERLIHGYVELLEEEVVYLIETGQYLQNSSPEDINSMDFDRIMLMYINRLNYDNEVLHRIRKKYVI